MPKRLPPPKVWGKEDTSISPPREMTGTETVDLRCMDSPYKHTQPAAGAKSAVARAPPTSRILARRRGTSGPRGCRCSTGIVPTYACGRQWPASAANRAYSGGMRTTTKGCARRVAHGVEKCGNADNALAVASKVEGIYRGGICRVCPTPLRNSERLHAADCYRPGLVCRSAARLE